jgi:thiol-disulfide isomerase/thioredoxin
LQCKNAFPRLLLAQCLLLTLATAAHGLAADTADQHAATVDWKLRCADGTQIGFYETLQKGPVLVSFWALWCKPCLKEMPHLDSLAAETKGKLTVLAINMDSSKSVAKVRPFLRSKGYDLIVPLDTAGDVGRLLQVGGMIPFLVLYDSDGREVYRHIGYKEGDEVELKKQVTALLATLDAEGEE